MLLPWLLVQSVARPGVWVCPLPPSSVSLSSLSHQPRPRLGPIFAHHATQLCSTLPLPRRHWCHALALNDNKTTILEPGCPFLSIGFMIYKLYFVKVIHFLPTPFTSFSTIIDIPYNKNSLWSGHLEFWFDWYQRYQRFYVSYKLSTELHGEIQNKQWSLRLLRIHYLNVTTQKSP